VQRVQERVAAHRRPADVQVFLRENQEKFVRHHGSKHTWFFWLSELAKGNRVIFVSQYFHHSLTPFYGGERLHQGELKSRLENCETAFSCEKTGLLQANIVSTATDFDLLHSLISFLIVLPF